jgi:DNA-binding CsgD family transcriptional regulator
MMRVWPMVGRDAELATILGRLRRGIGSVVVGEAGLGKSALVGEVQQRLISQGWRSQLVSCSGVLDFPLHAVAGGAAREDLQVLVVDDVHLLDDDSADVLWRLARQGMTRIVVTLRPHLRVPDRVTRLWTGGSCERLDLAPLAEDDVRRLLEAVLTGDVDDYLSRFLTNRAAGNALLLRELVRSGVESGAIACSQQVWRLAGELPIGTGAADVIRASLAELDSDELRAAQLLAVGDPLRIHVAEAIIGQPLMEALEDKRVAALTDTGSGPVLTLGHPLYGDVLRGDIAPLRLRRLRRELIDAFAVAKAPSRHDVVRSVVWRVELGEALPAAELLAAARLARSMSQSTAERLSRAALAAGNSVDAVLLLAEILVMQGRVAEADALFEGLDIDSLRPDERHAVTYSKALGRTRLGELSDVIAMITGSEVDATANSQQVQAIYGQALMFDGRIDEASTVVAALFADRTADPVTQILAACILSVRGVFVGRASESVRIMREALPAAEAARTAAPFGYGNLTVAASIALAGAGRLDEAEDIAQGMYDRALAEDDQWLRPRGASALGVTALMRGRVRTAVRYFRITVASLNVLDEQYLCYNLPCLARGAALAGFVDEARRALHPTAHVPRFSVFRADWLIAEAALMAADGDFDTATEHALRAARHAASLGQWATMALAAHDAVRYTPSPEAARLLAAAAEQADGPLYPCLADYAHARVEDDAATLSSVSVRLEELGTILYAAEAAYAAARGYRTAGAGRAAAAAAVRASNLHARCEHAAMPWAIGFQSGELLTHREEQVALMAAAGNPDATIATDLQISIRTVQNHLTRAYRKLAVTGRHELPNALSDDNASAT